MLNMWRSVFAGILVCLIAGGLLAQSENSTINPKNNSPLSRFGLGDALDQYLAGAAGMGGLSAAYNDPFHLNLLNPASLPYLQTTAFEVGLYTKYAHLTSEENTDDIWSGNLNYIALGFPLLNPINEALDRKRSPWDLGMSLSLAPYTLVGYDIETQQVDPDYGTATNFLKGTGGTYKLGWGGAAKYKGFSVGVNASYLFGKLTNSRRVGFDSLAYAYSTEFLDEIGVSGFVWQIGAQYSYDFKSLNKKGEKEANGRRLTIGLYGNPTNSFNTKSNRFYSRYLSESVKDTIVYTDDVKGSGSLPPSFTFGVGYEVANKWRIGSEYSHESWSKYENEAKPEKLSNAWRASIGGEYIPNISSYNNYFDRIRYRAGLFYSTDPRSVAGDQVNKYGLTFGFGFPLIMPRQQTSFINTGFEIGKFGVADVIQETYYKLTLGFTLNDNSWFFKRKFN